MLLRPDFASAVIGSAGVPSAEQERRILTDKALDLGIERERVDFFGLFGNMGVI